MCVVSQLFFPSAYSLKAVRWEEVSTVEGVSSLGGVLLSYAPVCGEWMSLNGKPTRPLSTVLPAGPSCPVLL